MSNHLELNLFSKHALFEVFDKVVSKPHNAFMFDDETIGNILHTEGCPTLTTFWQNLLKYIILDVSFEEQSAIPFITMRYKKEDIEILFRASTKDNIEVQLFYKGSRLDSPHNIEQTVCIEIAFIHRELSNLITRLVPTTPDSNIPECSVLTFTT